MSHICWDLLLEFCSAHHTTFGAFPLDACLAYPTLLTKPACQGSPLQIVFNPIFFVCFPFSLLSHLSLANTWDAQMHNCSDGRGIFFTRQRVSAWDLPCLPHPAHQASLSRFTIFLFAFLSHVSFAWATFIDHKSKLVTVASRSSGTPSGHQWAEYANTWDAQMHKCFDGHGISCYLSKPTQATSTRLRLAPQCPPSSPSPPVTSPSLSTPAPPTQSFSPSLSAQAR